MLRRADAGGAKGEAAAERIVRGELVLDPSRHQCTWKGKEVHLTVTEFLLLKSLAERPGHVKNRDQLMDAAYGETIYVDDRTIDSHIKRVRRSSARSTANSSRSKRSTASDTDTATPEPGRRQAAPQAFGSRLAAALGRLMPAGSARACAPSPRRRIAVAAAPPAQRERRHSPLTRRILLLNIVPVALLTLGAVYLSDYEDELIDAELASLLVQGEMVAAGIGEVAVVGGETTVNRLDADAARQLLTRLVRPTGVRARLFSETGELLGDSAMLSDAGRIHVVPAAAARERAVVLAIPAGPTGSATGSPGSCRAPTAFPSMSSAPTPTVRDYPEAASALRGFNASAVRIAGDGRLILSAAVPVQRYKQVLGALMLTRDNRAIAASLRAGPLRHADHRRGGARHHRAAVALSRRHHHPADRAAGARRRRGAPRTREPAGDSRPRQARRRDRRPERRAALDDRRAVAAHQHHRELRRRRGARAQEPADLAALGDRDGGAARPRRRNAAPS